MSGYQKSKRHLRPWVLPAAAAVVLIPAIIILIFILPRRKSPMQGENSELSETSSYSDSASENSEAATASSEVSSVFSSTIISSSVVSSKKADAVPSPAPQYSSAISSQSSSAYNNYTRVETGKWFLRLVGTKNPLPDGFKVDLSVINTSYTRYGKKSDSLLFDSRAVAELVQMVEDANKQGIKLTVYSPYRSIERQREIYENRVDEKIKTGLTRSEAMAVAAQRITPPGCSEHNLGLACDMNIADDSFTGTKECNWLIKNAENYGFVMRYPEHKVSITGVDYESWHYRYVTVPHAKKMNELDMCLEEYIDWLNTISEQPMK